MVPNVRALRAIFGFVVPLVSFILSLDVDADEVGEATVSCVVTGVTNSTVLTCLLTTSVIGVSCPNDAVSNEGA